RPDPWGLSSYYLLYSFLWVDMLRWLVISPRRIGPGILLSGPALAAALVVFPHSYILSRTMRQDIRASLANPKKRDLEDCMTVSGLHLAPHLGRLLQAKAAYLLQTAPTCRLMCFTMDSFLLPKLAPVSVSGGFASLGWELQTRTQYERLLQKIIATRPTAILFDDLDAPELEGSQPVFCRIFPQIKNDLSTMYERRETVAGWEVWRRKDSPPQAAVE